MIAGVERIVGGDCSWTAVGVSASACSAGGCDLSAAEVPRAAVGVLAGTGWIAGGVEPSVAWG